MKNLQEFQYFSLISTLFLDFDGVLTDNSVLVDENGLEYARCSRYDGFGIQALVSLGVDVVVLTTERIPIAQRRCEKLGVPCFHSLNDKYEFAMTYLHVNNSNLEKCAFIGNDLNDYPLLQRVKLPIVTPDCHPSVRKPEFFVTKAKGGYGCVREVADLLTTALTSTPKRSS